MGFFTRGYAAARGHEPKLPGLKSEQKFFELLQPHTSGHMYSVTEEIKVYSEKYRPSCLLGYCQKFDICILTHPALFCSSEFRFVFLAPVLQSFYNIYIKDKIKLSSNSCFFKIIVRHWKKKVHSVYSLQTRCPGDVKVLYFFSNYKNSSKNMLNLHGSYFLWGNNVSYSILNP